jgi:hypothetical protein
LYKVPLDLKPSAENGDTISGGRVWGGGYRIKGIEGWKLRIDRSEFRIVRFMGNGGRS